MSPSTRGIRTSSRVSTRKRTVTATARMDLPVPSREPRVVLQRIPSSQSTTRRSRSAGRPAEPSGPADEGAEIGSEPMDATPAPAPPRAVSRGRGRPRRVALARPAEPATEPEQEPAVSDLIPVVVHTPEGPNVGPAQPETPPAPAEGIAVVDLTTPQSTPMTSGRPVEVDLTCELDDEVYVVLEDIVNPRRSTSNAALPLRLGASPPSSRPHPALRRFRRTYARPMDATIALDDTAQSLEEEIERFVGESQDQDQPSTSRAGQQQEQQQQQQPDSADTSERIHCPICLDSLSQIKKANNQFHSTICGHLFCGPCIRRAVESTKQCPTCRRSLDLRKIHPIFI